MTMGLHLNDPSKESKESETAAPNPDLPVEIWLYIAELMQPTERLKLLSLNRLFFELAMDQLYERLSLVSNDLYLFAETMELLCNPTVARRVRSVTIWPIAVHEALINDKNEFQRWHRGPPPSPTSPGKKSLSWLHDILHLRSSSRRAHPVSPSPPTQATRTTLFQQGIANLTRVEEVTIYVPTKTSSLGVAGQLNECLSFSVIQNLWPAVKDSVRRVTLDIPSSALGLVVPSNKDDFPPHLRRLDLLLRPPRNVTVDPDTPPLSESLPLLTKNLAEYESLASLAISTQIPNLWDSLVPLPSLTTLVVENMSINQAPDLTKTDIHHFLLSSPTIENLTLSHSRVCRYPPTPSTRKIESPTLKPLLPHLKSLSLTLAQPPSECRGYLNYLANIIRNAENVHLRGALSLREFKILLDRLYTLRLDSRTTDRILGHVRTLELAIQALSPELVELLAQRFPNLTKLKLEVEVIISTDKHEVAPGGFNPYIPPLLREEEERAFISKIHKRAHWPGPASDALKSWAVYDIAVLQWVMGEGRRYNWDVMNALASIVPSIKSFAEQGHNGQAGLAELAPKHDFVGLGKRSEAWG